MKFYYAILSFLVLIGFFSTSIAKNDFGGKLKTLLQRAPQTQIVGASAQDFVGHYHTINWSPWENGAVDPGQTPQLKPYLSGPTSICVTPNVPFGDGAFFDVAQGFISEFGVLKGVVVPQSESNIFNWIGQYWLPGQEGRVGLFVGTLIIDGNSRYLDLTMIETELSLPDIFSDQTKFAQLSDEFQFGSHVVLQMDDNNGPEDKECLRTSAEVIVDSFSPNPQFAFKGTYRSRDGGVPIWHVASTKNGNLWSSYKYDYDADHKAYGYEIGTHFGFVAMTSFYENGDEGDKPFHGIDIMVANDTNSFYASYWNWERVHDFDYSKHNKPGFHVVATFEKMSGPFNINMASLNYCSLLPTAEDQTRCRKTDHRPDEE